MIRTVVIFLFPRYWCQGAKWRELWFWLHWHGVGFPRCRVRMLEEQSGRALIMRHDFSFIERYSALNKCVFPLCNLSGLFRGFLLCSWVSIGFVLLNSLFLYMSISPALIFTSFDGQQLCGAPHVEVQPKCFVCLLVCMCEYWVHVWYLRK